MPAHSGVAIGSIGVYHAIAMDQSGRHSSLVILRRAALMAGLAALLAAAPAAAQTAEHVFIFVIDGVRASEGFDDPSHGALAPLAGLVEQGALLTRMDVTGQTVTLPAHHVLVTGNRSDYGGTPPYEGRRLHAPRTPTLFEAYRRHTGAAEDSCWVTGNTGYLHDTVYSLMPGYGDDFMASRALTFETLVEDAWTWEQIDGILADHEVDLMVANLHEVDRKGHEADWDGYLDMATAGAEGIAAFWDRLQDDPVYAGKTVLMVTTDHGRHLEEQESGWVSHGCYCRGCRNAFLLAVGPGIRVGVQDDGLTNFMDVAPTVAQLMDFPMPYVRGRVLTEILEGGEELSRGLGGRHEPQLTRAGGRLVRAYELHDPSVDDDLGAHQVMAEYSEDLGESWTEVFSGELGSIQSGPMVRSHGESAFLGWLSQWAGGEEVQSRLARLDPATGYATEIFGHEMTSSTTSASNLSMAGRGDLLVLAENNARNGITQFWLSEDDGDSWDETGPEPFVNGRYFPRDWQQMQAHDAWVAVFSAHVNAYLLDEKPNENTQVFAVYSSNAGEDWEQEVTISSGVEPSIQPQLVRTTDGTLHVVWADMSSGRFQLTYSHSANNGLGFSPPLQLTDAPVAAWEPALATDDDRVVVAWSQVESADEATIHVALVDPDGLWGEQVLTDAGTVSRTPAMASLDDCTSVVTWSQSDLSAPWELVAERIVSSPIGATSATAQAHPKALTTFASAAPVTLSLEVTLGDDDLGVDWVTVVVPPTFTFGEVIDVSVDGDLVDATAVVEGHELALRLDDLVANDGARIDVVVEIGAAGAVGNEGSLEIVVHHGRLGCPIPAEGDLQLVTVAAEALDPPPLVDDEGCECGIGGAGSAATAGTLIVLVAWLGRRRR